MSGGSLHHESAVSAFTGEPYVLLTWGRESGQLSPDEAAKLGADIISAAQAARHDAAIVAELTSEHDFPREAIAGFIGSLRRRLSA